MLVARLIESVREGREIQLQGENGLRINPVHVSDAARATAAAARLDHSAIINVARPQALSLREMNEAIGEKVGKALQFAVGDASGATVHFADTTQMNRLVGKLTARLADTIGELLK